MLGGLLLAWLAATFAVQLLTAAPVAAHAELLSTSPRDGAQLSRSPAEVTLRFSEPVTLPERGLRLHNAGGSDIATPKPVEAGSTVHWGMPAALPRGSYRVDWRVVSDDGHPVAGSLSFGVEVGTPPAGRLARAPRLSWPVTLARLGGYLGFVLVAGVIALTLLCWAEGRDEPRTRTLLRVGLALGVASSVVALFLQGPYASGEPLTRVFDRSLMTEVAHTPFGAWTQLRLYLFLLLGAMLWPAAALGSRLTRRIAGIGVLATAVTYSGTGHAAATGGVGARVVDSAHVVAAGVWGRGLLALVVAATSRDQRPTVASFAAFSKVALLAVIALITTGVVNAVLHLSAVPELWRTHYGQLLSAKLVLVLLALAAAVVSRRRLRRESAPWTTVRIEAGVTLLVVAVTAVLASTAPPDSLLTPSTTAGGHHARHQPLPSSASGTRKVPTSRANPSTPPVRYDRLRG